MSDFSTILIEDSRIANITEKETFAVMSGASQCTYQAFNATSTSSSSIVFNCQIPSENVIIDRHLLMQSTVTLTITLNANNYTDNTILAFNYGLSDSLQAFPLNSLCNSQQCSINNTTISQNTKDILPMVLKMYDKRKLNRYNSICPSLPDSYYAYYADGLGTLNNVLAGYNNQSLDEDFTPRGGFAVNILSVSHAYNTVTYTNTKVTNSSGVITSNNNTQTGSVAGTPDTYLIMPAGETSGLESSETDGNGNTTTTTTDLEYTENTFVIVLQFTTTEPFIALSPWTNTNANNQAGLVGINNISFNLSIDSMCKRVFSTMNPYISNIALGGTVSGQTIQPFIDTKLLFNFLSLQPESYRKISSKNCVPYLDFPRYLSVSSTSSAISSLGTSTLTSNNLQLSQIPDLILITVRKPMVDQTWADSSSFLTIKKISITFNNASGLLSSANAQQLYLMSYKNGSGQSFYEFSGTAKNNYTGAYYVNGANQVNTYDGDDLDNLVGKGDSVATTGSMLVINPSLDLSLPAYLSNSSLGQYNFTFNIDVYNQYKTPITPEICVITVNSGIFTTQLGSSVINTGLLTKEEVLKAKEQQPTIDTTDHKRYLGGSLSNFGMSNILKLVKKIPYLNDDKVSDAVINNAGSLSGAGVSGGRIKRHLR
jgi:hypothetical protein